MKQTSTVLIVDDDPTHLELYSLVVQRGGFKTLTALVTPSGVNLPNNAAVDVVILDYRLNSSLTTVEVARQLNRMFPARPIVILSDNLWMPDEMKGYAVRFVRKGEPQRLLDTLHELPLAEAG